MLQEQAFVTLRRWTELAEGAAVLARCLGDLSGIGMPGGVSTPGLEQFVRPGQSVLIKPNITANALSQTGGVTHEDLVEALVREAQRCGAGRIIVGEGNGKFGTTLETAFPTGRWREMAARTGAELYNIDGGPYVDVVLPQRRYPAALPFSQLALEVDVLISVPCLKTHAACDYTVALKNHFALTSQWKRTEIHRQGLVEESLVDLNRIRKADLTVVDGWDGSEGVAGGTDLERPGHARLMLAGTDPVAVDVVARQLMEMECRTRYLEWAIQDGLGIGDPTRIVVRGDSVTELKRRFMTPWDEMCIFLPGLTFRDRGACSGCRVAAVGAMNRFRYQNLLRPLTLVMGEGGVEEEVPPHGETVILGNCAARDAGLGAYVEGCPPSVERIVEILEKREIVCTRCRSLVCDALAGLPEAFLAHLRVAAAGAEVYSGSEVRRDGWHQELLVGGCMQRYAGTVRVRAPLFGIDAERDIAWLPECPPTEDSIREALGRLQEQQ